MIIFPKYYKPMSLPLNLSYKFLCYAAEKIMQTVKNPASMSKKKHDFSYLVNY